MNISATVSDELRVMFASKIQPGVVLLSWQFICSAKKVFNSILKNEFVIEHYAD